MAAHPSIPTHATLVFILALSTAIAACSNTVDSPASSEGSDTANAPGSASLTLDSASGDLDAAPSAPDESSAGASEGGEEAASDAGAPANSGAADVDDSGQDEDSVADDGNGASDDAGIDESITVLPPPSCADLEPTPFDAEGPFFTPDTPERTDLREPGEPGTPLRIVGYVLDTDCRALPGAKLDVWHTDDAGDYDNEGYRYRGHLFTDAAGTYVFDTILPGTYPGRPRHIHLHVHATGESEPTLTSQLYFRLPDGTDDTAGVDPALVLDLATEPGGEALAGRFDFVLKAE